MKSLDFALLASTTIAVLVAWGLVEEDRRSAPARALAKAAPQARPGATGADDRPADPQARPRSGSSWAGLLSLLGLGERGRPPATAGTTGTPARPPGARDDVWIEIADSGTSQGSASAFDDWYRSARGDPRGCPFHYVIGNGNGAADGEVQRTARGGAALDPGEQRVRVCLVGRLDRAEASEAQRRALVQAVRALCAQYRVPPDRVVGAAKREGLSIAWLRDQLRP